VAAPPPRHQKASSNGDVLGLRAACWCLPVKRAACWCLPVKRAACWCVPVKRAACWCLPVKRAAGWLVWARNECLVLHMYCFIGSLKAGFVTERSKPGSCRAFRFQYPIFSLVLHMSCLLDLVLKPNECLCCLVLTLLGDPTANGCCRIDVAGYVY